MNMRRYPLPGAISGPGAVSPSHGTPGPYFSSIKFAPRMFRPHADTDNSSRDTLQQRKARNQSQQNGRTHLSSARSEDRPNHAVLHHDLQSLRHTRRKEPPFLHFAQHGLGYRARAQPFGENIRGRHRVLDREIGADAADGRHRVGRIADA